MTLEELQTLIEEKYSLSPEVTAEFFNKVDVDFSGDLNPGEIVDFRLVFRNKLMRLNTFF